VNGGANFHATQVLIGSQDASLYCLDATTGAPVWKLTTDDQVRCSPTIAAGHVFLAGCDGNLHVVDLNNGQEVHRVPIGSPTGTTPAARGDHVYFGTENGTFFAIDWRRGRVGWTHRDRRHTTPIRSSAAVTDRLVVYGARDKCLHALDVATGKEVWSFSTRGYIDGSPVIAGQYALVGSADGRLYAIDLQRGEAAWQYDAGGGFSASPAVAGDYLVIGNEDGTLYAFQAGPTIDRKAVTVHEMEEE